AGDARIGAGGQRREYDTIAARLVADGHERVLDWGTGYGQIADRLIRAGLQVEAFDYLPSLAAATERRALEPYFPELTVLLSSDPVHLPYPTAHFTAVLSCGVLEHVESPEQSLTEIKRVRAPGGNLYVYKLPNERSYLEWIARHSGLDYHGQLPFDRLYNLESARRLLEDAGFTVAEIRYANMLPLTLTSGWL